MSSLSTPSSPQEAPRPSSRTLHRGEVPLRPSKSRTRKFLASVSRSRSRPGTPDLSAAGFEELPRRSQSHEAMTTLSKMPSLVSVVDNSTRPTTRESNHHSEWRQDRQTSLAMSLLQKSSRLLTKRKSSNRLRSPEIEHDEWIFTEPNASQLDLKHKPSSGGLQRPALKHSISDPYNFQHLNHASQTDVSSLQTANKDELANEFQAIQDSQSPNTELIGIKAESIQKPVEPFPALESPTFDLESLTTSRPESRDTSRHTTRPSSPGGNSATDPSLHSSKSVESFTRLHSRSFSNPKPPISPPPRRSSRRPMPLSNLKAINTQASLESPILPHHGAGATAGSKTTLSHLPLSPTLVGNVAETGPRNGSQEEIAQAMTTPDDSAYVLHSQPPETPHSQLEDVPEEEEVVASAEDSDPKHVRHAKSMPSARHFSRIFPSGACVAAGASDPVLPSLLPGETIVNIEDIPAGVQVRVSKRVSNGKTVMVESWEDGVDYCYEQMMEEIDSMRDWDPELESEDRTDGRDGPTPQPGNDGQGPYSGISFLKTGSLKSAASSNVTVPGIVTPIEPAIPSPQILTVPKDGSGSTAFTLSPSLLIPKEYTSTSTRVTHEDNSYHYALANVESSKQNYNFFGGLGFETDLPKEYSPRSSVARSDSSAKRAASHSQSSSASSVPDLIGGKIAGVRTAEGLNINALRQDFLKAADLLPHDQLEAATPPPGTPVKTTFPKGFPKPSSIPLPATSFSSTPRSRSNSDSANSLLNALPKASGPPTPTLAPSPNKKPQGVRPLEAIGALKPPRHAHRMRSSSLAHTAVYEKQKGHRTSYSLFPTPPTRTGLR